MNIILNGEPVETTAGRTVGGLLEDLQISRERVAVEVALEIVPKANYDTHILKSGDKVEIVQFVGGG